MRTGIPRFSSTLVVFSFGRERMGDEGFRAERHVAVRLLGYGGKHQSFHDAMLVAVRCGRVSPRTRRVTPET
jgi:hypothetical protein